MDAVVGADGHRRAPRGRRRSARGRRRPPRAEVTGVPVRRPRVRVVSRSAGQHARGHHAIGPGGLVDGQQRRRAGRAAPRARRPWRPPTPCRGPGRARPSAPSRRRARPAAGRAAPGPGVRTWAAAKLVERVGLVDTERADAGPAQVAQVGAAAEGSRRGRRPARARRCPSSSRPRSRNTPGSPSGRRRHVEAVDTVTGRGRRSTSIPARASSCSRRPPTFAAETMGGTCSMTPVSVAAAARTSSRVTAGHVPGPGDLARGVEGGRGRAEDDLALVGLLAGR